MLEDWLLSKIKVVGLEDWDFWLERVLILLNFDTWACVGQDSCTPWWRFGILLVASLLTTNVLLSSRNTKNTNTNTSTFKAEREIFTASDSCFGYWVFKNKINSEFFYSLLPWMIYQKHEEVNQVRMQEGLISVSWSFWWKRAWWIGVLKRASDKSCLKAISVDLIHARHTYNRNN